MYFIVFFFFFQAEDGIRDVAVTGVQTCALPISISWNTFDNQGRGEGLGSRYFNVLNTGGSGIASPEDVIPTTIVQVRHGLHVHREPDPLAPDADGGYSVTMEEVGHIELHLGATTGNTLVQ